MVHNIKPGKLESSAGTPTGTAKSLKGLNIMSNTTLIVSATVAKSIASLINIAEPKSSALPLQYVRVELSNGQLRAVATDRYVVIVAEYEAIEAEPGEAVFYIDATTAKFITGAKGDYEFEFTVKPDYRELRIEVNQAGMTVGQPNFNYPPVVELWDSIKPAEQADPLSLNFTFFTRLAKIAGLDGKKLEQWIIQPSVSSGSGKPGPLQLTARGSSAFRALVQPNLIPA